MKRNKRGINKEFQIQMCKNIMKRNYNIPIDTIDLNNELDFGILPEENWTIIKPKLLQLCTKPNKVLFI